MGGGGVGIYIPIVNGLMDTGQPFTAVSLEVMAGQQTVQKILHFPYMLENMVTVALQVRIMIRDAMVEMADCMAGEVEAVIHRFQTTQDLV
jgi:hypothetical protein